MTTEPDPTLDDVPLESAVQAEAEAAEPEVTETRPPRPPLDDRTQLAVGAGLAVADHRPAREPFRRVGARSSAV